MVKDHKPLLSIFNLKTAVPPIAAARMQRLAMFLSAYQYTTKYKCGKSHANANFLSRLPIHENQDLEDLPIVIQASYVEELPVMAADVAKETIKDSTLAIVHQYVMEGWPHKVQEEALKPCYQCKDQLATDQGCLLWGLRVIISPNLQAEMLNELHATHRGW